MKTAVQKVSKEQAEKEARKFGQAALAISIVGLFIFGWIGVVGIIFGIRAMMMSFHKDIGKSAAITRYRAIAGIAITLGLIDVIAFYSLRSS